MVAAPFNRNDSNLTVRIGCKLIYEAVAYTPILLDVRPHLEAGEWLRAEQLWLGQGLSSEEINNSHGNRLIRLILPPGKTEIRHDALVEVPPTADLDGVEFTSAVPPSQVPPEFLRYLLPSRFCESDKLSGFAWQTFGNLVPGWPRVRAISEAPTCRRGRFSSAGTVSVATLPI